MQSSPPFTRFSLLITPSFSLVDPHFYTFQGQAFDYHGECDLVLLTSSSLDVDLHIRTLGRDLDGYLFSEISTVALRIGTDIIEYGLEDGVETMYLNGVLQLPSTTLPATVGGFPLNGSVGSYLEVVFGSGQIIRINFFNKCCGRVLVWGCNDFADSRGLLGTCNQPADYLGRDGTTSFMD